MNAITLPPARSLSPGRAPARARDLLLAAPSLTPQVTNAEVSRHGHEHAEAVGLAVVVEGLPIGLINRNVFMEGFARASVIQRSFMRRSQETCATSWIRSRTWRACGKSWSRSGRMSQEEIKQAYRAQLRNEEQDGVSKGAGLGALTIARDASPPIDYSIVETTEKGGLYAYFYLHAVIRRPRAARLAYLNSASTRMLFNLFDRLNAYASQGHPVTVHWRHDAEDDSILEFGNEMADDFQAMEFRMQTLT